MALFLLSASEVGCSAVLLGDFNTYKSNEIGKNAQEKIEPRGILHNFRILLMRMTAYQKTK